MKREDLLRSKEFWLVQIQSKLFSAIEGYMKQRNLNRTQFAETLGVTKGYITQVLNGDFDHKLSKLVELSLASNKVPILYFENLDEFIRRDEKNDFHNEKPVQFHSDVVELMDKKLLGDIHGGSTIGVRKEFDLVLVSTIETNS